MDENEEKLAIGFAIAAIIGALVVVIIGAVTIMQTPPESRHAAKWHAEFHAAAEDPTWRAEQDRIARKHGRDRVVYYTPEGAFFYDDQGRKCRFQ